MSTESLLSSTTTSSFTGDIDSYLDKIGSKAPQSWRKPRSRIYDHNRTLGHEYYQPMVDYIVTKENTGVYNTRKSVHLPVEIELQQERSNESPESQMSNSSTDLGDFLVRSYAKQIRERNATTANVHYYLLHGSRSSTDFSKDNMLGQHAPADFRRSYWLRELTVLNKDRIWDEDQKIRADVARREAVDRKLAEEEYAKHMSDPEVVSWLREGAKAAVYWCHRSPLSKEERQARLEGKKYVEPEPDLKKFYYY